MNIETFISGAVRRSVEALYGELGDEQLQIQKTRKEFEGDYTLVTFPLLRRSRKSPEATATEIGEYMTANIAEISAFNVIKGFLNLSLDSRFWAARFAEIVADEAFGQAPATGRTVMVEYSSPNTNKPLHLGHIRNNLLGYSVAQILKANGHTVLKANLVNDRGIHICKSMLAWKLYGNGETPASTGMKGDHLVGKYYVEFVKHYKAQIKELMAQGQSEEDAKKNAPIMREAQEMLRRWEARDPEVYGLWEMMNGWVFAGFAQTYERMGIHFDHTYLESETYLLGKDIVAAGLEKGVFAKREDGAVFCDLGKLGKKVVLRSDGTSVYITQDIGTTLKKFEDYHPESMVWVVGDEQNLHFQMLFEIMKRLGYPWADQLYHLSYGMVNLPTGKMKSREGTVVDADDLFDEMAKLATDACKERGGEELDPAELAERGEIIGLGALKFMLLKFNPKTTIMFDPAASLKFEGDTGPYIQYAAARINSIERKAAERGIDFSSAKVDWALLAHPAEKALAVTAGFYPAVLKLAAERRDCSGLAEYLLNLAKAFNRFYRECPVLAAETPELVAGRLAMADAVRTIIVDGLATLTIKVPQAM